MKSDSFSLRVVSANEERFPYFLRKYSSPNFSQLLDFQWIKKSKIHVSMTLAISESGEAYSLPQSPFGGIWVEESISLEALLEFIQAVLERLKEIKVHLVRVIQAPKQYEEHSDLISYALQESGFHLEKLTSHQFFIGKKRIGKFVQKSLPKYLSKLKENNLNVRINPIQNFSFLEEIRLWNGQKGYEMNFDENRLIQQVSEYPERYFLISISDSRQEKSIAHSLAVKLTPNSFYYYLSAIDPKSQAKGLGEILLMYLFKLAEKHKAEFIDLGSSESEAGPNHSLIFFKSRFSNDISNKSSWSCLIK
ncbi:hypothetical protein [Algoriphagus boseongensis]|uniref:hypothetical protein n=1 Tax=Algoriphagus boseongensis TaxID=1442587 RepID=UPI001FB82387|nr:hypothetical protein [Algoriphagus boseongensis]